MKKGTDKAVKTLMDKMPHHKVMLNPKSYRMAHPVYSKEDLNSIDVTHRERKTIADKIAFAGINLTRNGFDLVSGYNPDKMNTRNWLNRIVFLETVAGIPGMVGGMHRHLTSLRKLERDNGWIHHLLQEAENERMHLFMILTMRNPGVLFRLMIAGAQWISWIGYFSMYAIAPTLCHRAVGFLEEEAVHTYTVLIEQMDVEGSELQNWG